MLIFYQTKFSKIFLKLRSPLRSQNKQKLKEKASLLYKQSHLHYKGQLSTEKIQLFYCYFSILLFCINQLKILKLTIKNKAVLKIVIYANFWNKNVCKIKVMQKEIPTLLDQEIMKNNEEFHVQKDQQAIRLQKENVIAYKIIKNDDSEQNKKWLVNLKNIFTHQLSKMPKEYITRLVFDKYHECLVMLKQEKQIIGGICFRQFKQNQLTEIAFLAIHSKQQIKGFGRRLMNMMKSMFITKLDQMQQRGIKYLITYADNLAIGFFKKQGFSRDITIPKMKWQGYIKDYDGGTKMEYLISQSMDYLNLGNIIKKQKIFLQSQIRNLSINKWVLEKSLSNYSKFKRTNSDGIEQQFPVDIMKLPGIKQSGWTWQQYEELRKCQPITIISECRNLIFEILNHPCSWPFKNPVPDDILNYKKVIKQPMDLSTIRQKIQNKLYLNFNELNRDLELMLDNCKKFNQAETIYFKNAEQLQKFIKIKFEKLFQIEKIINQSKSKDLIQLEPSEFEQKQNML